MSRHMTYAVAMLVVIIWGTTFISTKVLLLTLSPAEIMFYRYVLGYLALWAVWPHFRLPRAWREELHFACAGFFGGTLYFFTENYALKYTLASNVGILVATVPILTAIASRLLTRAEPFARPLLIGFLVSLAGVVLVIFNGHFILELNPAGDALAIAAAASWAVYAVLVRQIDSSMNGVYITRKIFFYSLLTMTPFLCFSQFRWSVSHVGGTEVIANLLFLGILASAVCFLLWSKVIWSIGAIRANSFIYFMPLVTMVASVIFLDEPVTVFAILGGILILGGVWLGSRMPASHVM